TRRALDSAGRRRKRPGPGAARRGAVESRDARAGHGGSDMERGRATGRTFGSCPVIRAQAAGLLLAVGLVISPASAAVDAPAPGTSPTVDRIREQKALRAGVGIGLPWLGQNPKTSEYFGPAYELGQRVAKVLAVELRPVSSTWDVIIAGLQSNRTDLIIAAL